MKRSLCFVISLLLCCVFLSGCFNEKAPEPKEDQAFFNVYPTTFFNSCGIEFKKAVVSYTYEWLTNEEFDNFSLDFVFEKRETEELDQGITVHKSVTSNGTTAELRTFNEKVFWMKFSGDGNAQRIVDLQKEKPARGFASIGPPPLEAKGPDAQYYLRAIAAVIEGNTTAAYHVATGVGSDQFKGQGTVKTDRAEYHFKNNGKKWVLIVSPL